MNSRPPNLVLDSRVEYQFGKLLGRGGYGAVYQGLNVHNGDFVAIKQINLSAIPKNQIGGIMTEIDLLKKLKHENIVKYIGYLKTKEFLNIVLEYVENGSLASIVQNMGRFPESLVRVYISQVLQGLLYLHEQGVVHRDIKGANILTTKKGHVKLADFGVASEQMSAPTDQDEVVGTPYWMAPEIIELAGATPLSDIWSVGCTVIELVTGNPPYFDLPPMPALFRIVQDDHPPIPQELSPALKDFLMECFQKDPLLRIDAKGLLKHPWIKSNPTTEVCTSAVAEQVIMSHNEEYQEKTATISIVTGKFIPTKRKENQEKVENTNKKDATDKTEVKDKKDRKKNRNNKQKDIKKSRKNSKKSPRGKSENIKSPRSKSKSDDVIKSPRSKSKSKELEDVIKSPRSKSKSEDVIKSPRKSKSKDKKSSRKRKVKTTKHPKRNSATKEKSKTITRAATDYDEGEWDDTLIIPVSELQNKFTKPKEVTKPKEPSEDKWSDDSWGDIEIKDAEPKEPSEDKWDDEWSDDKEIQSKPTKSTKPTKTDEDDDIWDDDFDLGKAFGGNEDTKEDSWGDDWDAELEDINDNKTNTILKQPDDIPEDDWDMGGGDPFDFSAKIAQITGGQDDQVDDLDDFDDIFDDEDFMTGTRDTFLALSEEVSQLLKVYHPDESDVVIRNVTEELIAIFEENPDDKSRLIRHSGAIEVLDILEIVSPSVADCVLKLINQIVEGDSQVQENLCLVGAIPSVLAFVKGECSKSVRIEVAKFVKQVCSGSGLTHQMFIACRGLPSLVSFLKTDNFKEDKDLVFMAIDGIQSVFELQSTTPKNDFCRLFVKCNTLNLLIKALLETLVVNAKKYTTKITEILLHFSSGDSVVKKSMADDSKDGVLQNLFASLLVLKKGSKQKKAFVNILKSIKQLSMDTSSLDPLENVDAIPQLIDLFTIKNITPDITNQLVSTLYNLTRIDRGRQEQAARAGIIPHLKDIINTNSPLKQFALEIILDLGKVPGGRIELSKYNGVEYYLDLLTNYTNWRVNTFDVISQWIRDDERVQEIMCQPANLDKLVSVFTSSSKPIFINIVEPIFRIVQSSTTISKLLVLNDGFVACLLKGLLSKEYDNLVRLKLMKILVILVENLEDRETFRKTHDLSSALPKLKEDRSILISELAEQLSTKYFS